MSFYNEPSKLFTAAGGLFVGLTMLICIIPALKVQSEYKPLPNSKPLTAQEERGRQVYIKEGCIGCHTQQVRNIDMDDVFGSRPSLAADYARNVRLNLFQGSTNLMGSERTGPDLTNVGTRQSNLDWQYSHLYNPRSVVPESIMPSYKWLFKVKKELETGDVAVNLPDKFKNGIDGYIVPGEDAKDLVAYLLSLKQVELPQAIPAGEFLYKPKEKPKSTTGGGAASGPDGAALYTQHCSACHQANGEGLPGAFPPLKGDPVVLGNDLELYVTIIMKGYEGLMPAYGPMSNVGEAAGLKAEEVTAIINHERTSWGNDAPEVSVEDVKAIMDKMN